jgi:hypothetical protein
MDSAGSGQYQWHAIVNMFFFFFFFWIRISREFARKDSKFTLCKKDRAPRLYSTQNTSMLCQCTRFLLHPALSPGFLRQMLSELRESWIDYCKLNLAYQGIIMRVPAEEGMLFILLLDVTWTDATK